MYEAITQQFKRTRPGLFWSRVDFIIPCPSASLGCTWNHESKVMLDIPTMYRVVAEHLEKAHQAVDITCFPTPGWDDSND